MRSKTTRGGFGRPFCFGATPSFLNYGDDKTSITRTAPTSMPFQLRKTGRSNRDCSDRSDACSGRKRAMDRRGLGGATGKSHT
jgi:hypothetical protein